MRKIEGKGSWRRPMSVSKEQYDKNWEDIFGTPYERAVKKALGEVLEKEIVRLRKRDRFEEKLKKEKR